MNNLTAQKDPYILFLPKWYPSDKDPQLGVFIRKHAMAVKEYKKVIVLYITGADQLTQTREISCRNNDGLIEYTASYRTSSGILKKILNIYKYIHTTKYALRIVCTEHSSPALIHSHVLLRPALLAWYFSRKYSISFLHTEHWTGFIYDAYQKKPFIYRLLCRKVINKAGALTVVSTGLLTAMKKYRVGNKKTFIVPNIIESYTPGIQAVRKDNMVKILTVADLVDRNKNISGALQAMAKIREEYTNIEYHIIGDGPDKEKLVNLAGKIDPAASWVYFHGRQDNRYVLDFMHAVDFILTNSNIETFSVVTAEAIAAGKPVIATRCGGPEYFVNPGNGLLISPGDHDALVEALRVMLSSYKDYDSVALSAGILGKFGKQEVGRQLMDIYNNLTVK